VYFVDAAHFVFAPFLGFLWCLTRLFVRAPSGRKRYNVLGALDAVTHRLVRVTNLDYINAESVRALLRAVAAAGTGLPITLVRDNARYQKCGWVQSLADSLGIELLYLTSYSPNLNLIERPWRFLRKESLDSTSYESFESFRAAIDRCLDDLPTKHRGEMETLPGASVSDVRGCATLGGVEYNELRDGEDVRNPPALGRIADLDRGPAGELES
jgi:transposase